MEEFFHKFEKLAREHFPEYEFKTWEELTEEDLAGLEDVYKRILIAHDMLFLSERMKDMEEEEL